MPHPFARPQSREERAEAPHGVVTKHPHALPGGTHPDVLASFEQHMAHSREHLDHLSAAIRGMNRGPRVLETATITIPAQGQEQGFEPGAPGVWEQGRYRVPFAAVAVLNTGTTALVVSTGGAQSSAPGGGQGQAIVPANAFAAWNMEGSQLSIYGPAGTQVTYTVFTDAVQPFVAAALAASGGATAPADAAAFGLAMWATPPELSYATATPAAGQMLAALTVAQQSQTITKLGMWVTAAAVTQVGGGNLNQLGIYTAAGVLLGSTADTPAAFTATGYKEVALTSAVPVVAGTAYYLCVLSDFSTQAAIAGSTLTQAIPLIRGVMACGGLAGQASMPASFNPAALVASNAIPMLTAGT